MDANLPSCQERHKKRKYTEFLNTTSKGHFRLYLPQYFHWQNIHLEVHEISAQSRLLLRSIYLIVHLNIKNQKLQLSNVFFNVTFGYFVR